MDIGKAILLCRTRRGLSQAKLAERIGCSVSYLSLLENGRRDPPISMIEKIANALQVPPNILIFLAADTNDLVGINKELAGDLARTALDLLNEQLSDD